MVLFYKPVQGSCIYNRGFCYSSPLKASELAEMHNGIVECSNKGTTAIPEQRKSMQREEACPSKPLRKILNDSHRVTGSQFRFLLYLFKRRVYLTHMLQMFLIPISRQSETSVGDSSSFRNPQGSGGGHQISPFPFIYN